MIIRKPYAFLIKNFKKIHIFLFILCAYIYYQNLRINAFVNEFLEFLTYDEVSESWFKEKFYEKVILENPIEYDLLKIFLDNFGILFTK